MRVWEAVHWGKDGYGNGGLPRCEADALRRYVRATQTCDGRGDIPAFGSRGVSVFAHPLVVLGLVRGVDCDGEPTVYLVTEGEQEATSE